MSGFDQRWHQLARRAADAPPSPTPPPPALGPLLDAMTGHSREADTPRWRMVTVAGLALAINLALAPLALRLLPPLARDLSFDLDRLPRPPAVAAPELPKPPILPRVTGLLPRTQEVLP